MRTFTLVRIALLFAACLLVMMMVSCGSPDAETPAGQPALDAALAIEPPAEVVVEAPNDAEDTAGEALDAAEGINLAAINVCELVPVAEIESVVGALRNAPEETISLDREKGCQYIEDANGQFFEITLYPLDHWGLVKYTLNEAAALEGVGDGAYTGAYSDAAVLEVLVKDRAVVGVRVSDENQQTALALYEIALKHLP
jgi:hypothetical protein